MNRDKEGVDFEWVTKPGTDYRQKRYFSKAEKAKRAAPKKSEPTSAKKTSTKAKLAAKKNPPKRDIVTMARDAIDRSAPTRPKARPGTTRPKARPNRDTATSVETPKVTTTKLDKAPVSPSTPRGSAKDVTKAEWEAMTRAERKEAGLPVSVLGGAMYDFKGSTPKSTTTTRRRPGGSSSRGYAKGGMVKANCGASMKPTQKSSRGR